MQMFSVKAVCVDLDGMFFTDTSFQTFKTSLAPYIEKEKRDYVLALSPQMKAFKTGKMSETDYRNRVQQELNLSLSHEEIFQILRESYEINPEVEQLVKELKRKGYQLCICSNNFPTRIRELDKKFNFLSLFDTVILSYEIGAMKPDKQIFEALLQKTGCQPAEIVYADDKESNLLEAKQLWISTFVFKDVEEYILNLKHLGVE